MHSQRSHDIATDEFKQRYLEQGYVFPVEVLSRQRAGEYLHRLTELEAQLGDRVLGNKTQLNYPHVIFQFANEIVRHPALLDRAEALLGPDILVWSATFFIKEPHTDSYVGWHQDLKYWGLSHEDGQVSAWIALGEVNQANGCMQFIRGSHRGELLDHRDTYSERNALSRGQEVEAQFDPADLAQVELQPGQASFHHGKLLHSSAPNRSDVRRVGMVVNYIAAHVQQTLAPEDFAMLVRGEDRYGHFTHVPEPEADLSAEALRWHQHILEGQNKVILDQQPAAYF